nr:hypothetical protein CFP56_56120 [Quercus suber]
MLHLHLSGCGRTRLRGSHTRQTSATFLTFALQGGIHGQQGCRLLHRIDLCGKVEKNWREEHGLYIITWDRRQQRLCHAPPQTGEMPRDHDYYRWYCPVTRKYVDCNSAKLDIMIESHLALLKMLPIGSREHNHVQRVLHNVVGLGGDPAANG